MTTQPRKDQCVTREVLRKELSSLVEKLSNEIEYGDVRLEVKIGGLSVVSIIT